MENKIWTINDKKEKKILRHKAVNFDFGKYGKQEINDLVKMMREVMIKAGGIGLAANQIGLPIKVFVAQIVKFDKNGGERSLSAAEQKFYAIFNPEIIKTSVEKSASEEGCLSVPGGYYGEVERPEKITLIGFDKNGKKIKIRAWGLLARVFQHEVDHLNGTLFIDKAKSVRKIESRK